MKSSRRGFLKLSAGAAALAALPKSARSDVSPRAPRIPTRMFWSWDHSTNWCENVYGAQNFGVGNAYTKPGAFFERDYRRVVDWCAAHDMQSICIAGLLRDIHGGIVENLPGYRSSDRGLEATRRLCAYAQEKGVRICIIGGLFAYGGAFYEGDHKYSLDRFLARNPDCMAVNERGEPHYAQFLYHGGSKTEPQGCPSSAKLRDFVVESYGWLFKAIPELGGIQMEAGDNGVCQCATCRERRGSAAVKSYKSLEDMAAIYPRVCEAVRAGNPDALVIAETYHHFLDPACRMFYAPTPGKDAQALLSMPKDIYWQWKCDARLEQEDWPQGAALPAAMRGFHHVMRSHAGTQWWGGRGQFDVDKIRKQCLYSSLSGLDAVSMFGEVAPFEANAEFNYLSLSYFADTPDAPMAAFVKDVMAPRLGGVDRAEDWVRWARLEWQPERIPDAVAAMAKIIGDSSDREVRRRWLQLASRLESFHWEWERNGHRLPVYAHHAVPEPKAADKADHL